MFAKESNGQFSRLIHALRGVYKCTRDSSDTFAVEYISLKFVFFVFSLMSTIFF